MSGAQEERAMTAHSLHLNATLDLHDEEMKTALFGLFSSFFDHVDQEVKVFDLVIIALALCILFITAVYCISVCYNRSRQSKRAQVYESAVTQVEPEDPVAVRAVKRSTSFINPLAFFQRSGTAKDNSRIYYIYSNPLPVGAKEDEEGTAEEVTLPPLLSIEEYAQDPQSGVILDPPIFYMQL